MNNANPAAGNSRCIAALINTITLYFTSILQCSCPFFFTRLYPKTVVLVYYDSGALILPCFKPTARLCLTCFLKIFPT